MKVLVIANLDVGLYKFRKELLQKMIDKGNEVYISLPNGNFINIMVDMGCKYIETNIDRRGINPITDLKLINCYKKIIKDINPDYIITYTIKPNIYAGIVASHRKKKYAINITGLGTAFQSKGLVLKIFILLYKAACKNAHTVIFENSANMQYFLDCGIVKKEQCLLNAGAGVNLEEYQFTEYPNDNEIRFLFIGRVMKEKGIDELYSAAKRIKQEYDNVYFDIVGPFEDDYKEITEELQKEGIIQYYGYQEDVKPFIKRCSCFVLPSYHEGMANTNLESAAMGRPLITSNIPGCKEAVVDGESGFLAEPQNATDLYNKIKSFIELPYVAKSAYAYMSYKYVSRNFDKKDVIKKTLSRM